MLFSHSRSKYDKQDSGQRRRRRSRSRSRLVKVFYPISKQTFLLLIFGVKFAVCFRRLDVNVTEQISFDHSIFTQGPLLPMKPNEL